MRRPLVAFLFAPAWLFAVLVPVLYAWLFRGEAAMATLWLLLVMIFVYGGMALLGLPAYRFLSRRGITAWWGAAATGFAAGALTWIAFVICSALPHDHSLRLILANLRGFGSLLVIMANGILGLGIGAAFWLIARPDRRPR